MSIRVNLPDMSSASSEVPVVVFLPGTTVDPSWGDTALIAQSATQAGFAFALLEYPAWDGSDWPQDGTMSSEMYCDKTAAKADQLFGHGDTTSLSMVCALEGIDCSKGVGVAGYSQGAAIGSMAAKLDDRVTAFFAMGMNTVVMWSAVGPKDLTCHRDATLPSSARRYLHCCGSENGISKPLVAEASQGPNLPSSGPGHADVARSAAPRYAMQSHAQHTTDIISYPQGWRRRRRREPRGIGYG